MRKLLLFLLLAFAPVSLCAQGVFIPPQTALKNINGIVMPIANATVTVCAAGASGIPCSPALVGAIFSNAALSNALSNPFTSDPYGNYQFAANPSTYATVTVTVTASGYTGQSYQVSLAVPGAIAVGANNAQLGDTLRYNVNGDGSWDAVNYASKTVVAYFDLVGAIESYGAETSSINIVAPGTQNNIYPSTYGDYPARQLVSTASASTNTTIGISWGSNANFGTFPFGSFYRWTHRFAANQTTNARYWMGLGSFCNGGTGQDGTAILSTAAYATDTPNKSTVGFRYSAGTDTTWQAVSITAGASSGAQTTVSTTVAIDTNPHTFEVVPVIAAGALTAYNYLIDHIQVATISTNLQTGIGNASACDGFAMMFWTGDNKNTANVVSGSFYYMMMPLR
jgi:hypothetical protein